MRQGARSSRDRGAFLGEIGEPWLAPLTDLNMMVLIPGTLRAQRRAVQKTARQFHPGNVELPSYSSGYPLQASVQHMDPHVADRPANGRPFEEDAI